MSHYALLGNGRLARHLRHYLSLLGLPCTAWARDTATNWNTSSLADPAERLRAVIGPATRIVLLVSDSAIAVLLRRFPFLHQKTLVHCSGAFSIPGVIGAHPLMTFGHELYSLEQYRRIPFMLDSRRQFSTVLPGLDNPHFAIRPEDKPRYHALCVVAGNFSQLLWQSAASGFAELGLPPSALQPFLQQSLQNFLDDPERALTGPLSRGDGQTVQRNLTALAGEPLEHVYRAFLHLHAGVQHNAVRLQEAAS